MKITVNGILHEIPEAWTDSSLLETLREYLGLVGAKFGCGKGFCGACKVHLNGVIINSCLIQTSMVADASIRTIEGIAGESGELHPVQQAWIDEAVPQCGYCQSGQIMQAIALLKENPNPTDEEINTAMQGNLCRCGTYLRIRRAIHRAASMMQKDSVSITESEIE